MTYKLQQQQQRFAATLCANSRDFWLRIGKYTEPEKFSNDPSQIEFFKLCHEVAKDHELPTMELITQRALAKFSEGAITEAALSYIGDIAESPSYPENEEGFIRELAETVKQDIRHRIATGVVSFYKSHGSSKRLRALLDDLDAVGEPVQAVTIAVPDMLDDIENVFAGDVTARMPFGVFELDSMLHGGSKIGTTTTFTAESKGGKSMMLNQLGAIGSFCGENVGYMQLEGMRVDQSARLLSAITCVPISDILNKESSLAHAKRIYKEMRAANRVGPIYHGTFPPKSVTAKQIRAWFDEQERIHKCRIRVRIVDYGDLVAVDSNSSDYEQGQIVWSELSAMAQNNGDPNWVFTASQAGRPEMFKDGKKPVDYVLTRKNIADSIHKVRLTDLHITINPVPTIKAENGFIYYIDADRHDGQTDSRTPPVPHMLQIGRMSDFSHLIR